MNDYNELFIVFLLARSDLEVAAIARSFASLQTNQGGPLTILAECSTLTSEQARAVVDQFASELDQRSWNQELTLRHWLVAVPYPRLVGFFKSLGETSPHAESEFVDRTVFAEGGLGQVWRVREAATGREVALKTIKPKYVHNESLLRRFMTEARLTARLEHPNIVPVYRFSREDSHGAPFYVMRFLKGDTFQGSIDELHQLAPMSNDWKMTLRRLVGQLSQVSEAMAYAHSCGVIHRDLKPVNIMVSSFRGVFVVDWGLAKVVGTSEGDADFDLSDVNVHESVAGQAVGTPQWMAPEQARGEGDRIDFRTDVFALGAILFAILHNRPPNEPQPGESFRDFLIRVAEGPQLPHFFQRERQLTELEAIAFKAMAKEPDQRYEGAEAFADDLERWLADEPVQAHRGALRARLGRFIRHHPFVMLTMMAASLLVGVCVAFFAVDTKLSQSNRLHTDAAELYATFAEMVRHQSGEVQILAARMADRLPTSRLDDTQVKLVLEEFSRFRPSLKSLHLVSADAQTEIDNVSSDDPVGFAWEMLGEEDRQCLASLKEDQVIVLLRTFPQGDKTFARLLMATPFVRAGKPELLVASFEPESMLKRLIPEAAQQSGAMMVALSKDGHLEFVVSKEEVDLSASLANQQQHLQYFWSQNLYEMPLPGWGDTQSWIRRINLPCPDDLSDNVIAMIYSSPRRPVSPGKTAGAGEMPFLTPVLIASAVILVLFLIVARVLSSVSSKSQRQRQEHQSSRSSRP